MTEPIDEPGRARRKIPAALRRHWVLSLAAVVVILLCVLLIRLRQHTLPAGSAGHGRGANGPVTVAVATVTKGDIPLRIPALGTITPLATVTVRTQISGQLQKIAFKEGHLVRAGAFIAQIDPRPYQAALNQAKATFDRDAALLANARLDLQRYQGLIKLDAIAEQQLDTQRALVKQYEGTVEGDQAQIKTAALNLQYTHIVAPLSGRLGLRQVDQGNYVTPGDANGIVVITQLQPISAIFSIPEDHVNAILRRLHQGATLEVQAYDSSETTELAVGKLLTIDNQIDPATGTFKLRALFDNADESLFPNQFVTIRLLENVLHNQVLIPAVAVHRGAPNGVVSAFVYRLNADRTVSVRPVVPGAAAGDLVAVASGLAPGDVVVTEGGDRLRDGAVVRPQSAVEAAAAAAPAVARRRHDERHRGAGPAAGRSGNGGNSAKQ